MIEEANQDMQPAEMQPPADPPPPTDPPAPAPTDDTQPVAPPMSPNDIIRQMTGQPNQLPVAPSPTVPPNTLLQQAQKGTPMKSDPADGTTGTVASEPDTNALPEQFAKPVTPGLKPNPSINQAPLPANPPKMG